MNDKDHVSSFAFVLGQTMGSLSRKDVKEYLKREL